MTMTASHRRCTLLCFFGLVAALHQVGADSPTCSANDELDPALKEISFEGDTFLAYVQPDVTSFYNGKPPASKAVKPKHEGFAGKFFNLSNRILNLYWEPHENGPSSLIRPMPPFHGGGTATFPTHRFFFSEKDGPTKVVHRFLVKEYPESLYVYDPYEVPNDPEATERNLATLTEKEREKYNKLKRTLRFNEVYLSATGRAYLANYPRPRPTHFMWRADYFGQEHWVTSKETHFDKLPPAELLSPIKDVGTKRVLGENDARLLEDYRVPDETTLNMTLKVLSCAPRAFEIPNFLSQVEVDHILTLANAAHLSLSSTGEPGTTPNKDDAGDIRKTRTSYNSWLPREKSPILDAVYRRAADLLRIDEALLRRRSDDEYPDLGTKRSIAESLQLVHYEGGQEYTAHHDFGYAGVDDKFQNARFSTLLLYLNEGMVGGATSFPRYVNAETFRGLDAVPEVGKAVLFYSQLPDGNLDDFSQHAATPVTDGEKWLVNLWVWDPVYEYNH